MRRKTATPAPEDASPVHEPSPERAEPREPPRGDNITLDDDDHAILDDIWKSIREETAAAAKRRTTTPGE
jgi:hypothetical protein